jgi:hypothetical protein
MMLNRSILPLKRLTSLSLSRARADLASATVFHCMHDVAVSLEKASWSDVCGGLQEEFSNRFPVAHGARPLEHDDFEWLKRVAAPDDHSDLQFLQFVQLWEWFSRWLNLMPHVETEWTSNQPVLLHGFVPREVAFFRVQRSACGTFLLRFSERQPGHLAATFRTDTKVER